MELFKNFQDLLELAKTLEDKIEKGEIVADVQYRTRYGSSIPRTGNIPRPSGVDTSRGRTQPQPDSQQPTSTPPEVVKPKTEANPSLEDVGGLAGVIKELKELIAIRLKRPDLLAKLGLEPTRGVLLVGPPGTGKTLTARAIARELDVNYIALVGPEVMSKYYGEAEQRLRQIFD